MELTILKKTDNEINIKVAGETHTLLNLLKTALLNNKHVDIATYDIKHPTISDPVLFVSLYGRLAHRTADAGPDDGDRAPGTRRRHQMVAADTDRPGGRAGTPGWR